jgi:hypothetical protein
MLIFLERITDMLSHKGLNNRGFAHAFILLLFVVVFGIAGAYYLVKSKADTVSFTLAGTHPQAAAQPTSVGKSIISLKGFNGKLYAGFGDYGANSGPIAVTPYDPATNTFTATPEFNVGTEMIATYRTWNNKLYVPSIDPGGGGLSSNFAVGDLVNGSLVWKQQSPSWAPPLYAPYMEHIFDANTLTGTDIWLAGSAGNDALVVRSTDGGVSWTEMLRVPGNSTYYYRFYGIAVLNSKLYVQAMVVNQSTNTVAAPESRSHMFSNGTWSQGPSLLPTGYTVWHPEVLAGKLVYFNWSAADGIPLSCPYVFNGSSVNTSCPLQVNDFSVVGSTLYAVGNGKVLSTTDLVNWYVQGTAPNNATSVTALDGKIYVGTSDSKIYSAPIATSPTLYGTSSGGGTTCHGKKCGGGGGSGGGTTCHGKKCTTATGAQAQ